MFQALFPLNTCCIYLHAGCKILESNANFQSLAKWRGAKGSSLALFFLETIMLSIHLSKQAEYQGMPQGVEHPSREKVDAGITPPPPPPSPHQRTHSLENTFRLNSTTVYKQELYPTAHKIIHYYSIHTSVKAKTTLLILN
jgi:hypothetical protein